MLLELLLQKKTRSELQATQRRNRSVAHAHKFVSSRRQPERQQQTTSSNKRANNLTTEQEHYNVEPQES